MPNPRSTTTPPSDPWGDIGGGNGLGGTVTFEGASADGGALGGIVGGVQRVRPWLLFLCTTVASSSMGGVWTENGGGGDGGGGDGGGGTGIESARRWVGMCGGGGGSTIRVWVWNNKTGQQRFLREELIWSVLPITTAYSNSGKSVLRCRLHLALSADDSDNVKASVPSGQGRSSSTKSQSELLDKMLLLHMGSNNRVHLIS